jgi:hypothetical protein
MRGRSIGWLAVPNHKNLGSESTMVNTHSPRSTLG